MIKLIYVCVGADKKEYLNMLRISLASARRHMDDIDIVILTDSDTAEYLSASDVAGEYRARVEAADIPEGYNTVEKSRYLKTNMRRLIRGDFMFIDCDTIICEDISGLRIPGSVCMVMDEHCLLDEQENGGAAIRRAAQQRGLDLSSCKRYFNSGVIMSVDDETALRFFDSWFRLWDSTRREGMHQDQYSLNAANCETDVITELDGTWNCQLTSGYRAFGYLRKVKVLHYLSAQPHGIYRLNDADFLRGDISREEIDRITEHPEHQFRAFSFYADDSPEHIVMQGSQFSLTHRIYTRHPRLYRFGDKLLSVFRKK